MPGTEWEERLKALLKKTGEDVKKVGADVKAQAQQLLTQAKDPETQKKVRVKLTEVGDWARKTGEEFATMVDSGLRKAEDAFKGATDKVAPKAEATPKAPKVTAPDEIREAKPAKKTVGKGKKKSGAKKAGAGAKKTIGKAASPAPTGGPSDTADESGDEPAGR